LVIDATEPVTIRSFGRAISLFGALHELGVGVSFDDFGC